MHISSPFLLYVHIKQKTGWKKYSGNLQQICKNYFAKKMRAVFNNAKKNTFFEYESDHFLKIKKLLKQGKIYGFLNASRICIQV